MELLYLLTFYTILYIHTFSVIPCFINTEYFSNIHSIYKWFNLCMLIKWIKQPNHTQCKSNLLILFKCYYLRWWWTNIWVLSIVINSKCVHWSDNQHYPYTINVHHVFAFYKTHVVLLIKYMLTVWYVCILNLETNT